MNDEDDVEKLAQACASFGEPGRGTLPEEYARLNNLAKTSAANVVSSVQSMNDAWAELLPILDEMQCLLSQRGVNRRTRSAAGLPTWITWLEGFLKETGLGIPVRTAQHHLTHFRRLGKENTWRPNRPVKLSPGEQRRLLAAAQFGNELVMAIDSNTDYRPALQNYKRSTIGPGKIEQLLDAIPSETVPTAMPQVLAPAKAAENTIGIASLRPTVALSQPGAALPKAGNGSGLADYLITTGDEGFAAALGGLEPSVMATCLQECARKIVGRFCTFDREQGQITVNVQYVQADAISRERAA